VPERWTRLSRDSAPEQHAGSVALGAAMEITVVIASRPDVPPDEELRTAVVADRVGYKDLVVRAGEQMPWNEFGLRE
jgi:hypothetical protein